MATVEAMRSIRQFDAPLEQPSAGRDIRGMFCAEKAASGNAEAIRQLHPPATPAPYHPARWKPASARQG